MTDISPKPQAGSVAPVEVQPWYKHVTLIVLALMAAIPTIIAMLVQLQQIPGLPTNIMAWIASAVTILGAVYAIYQKLFGIPLITPTAAARVIETTSTEK